MAKEIKVPVPDQTTEEVRIVKWVKGEGETVAKGEVILEVETDKSVMEVESIADGVLLKQVVAVDDMVAVSAVVGYVGQAGETIEDKSPQSTVHSPQEEERESSQFSVLSSQEEEKSGQWSVVSGQEIEEKKVEETGGKRVKASPMAKKLAGKLGVDLSLVQGSGPQGRIVREDVEKQGKRQKVKGKSEEIRGDIVGGRIVASPNAKRLAKELGVDLSRVRGSGQNGRIVGEDVELEGRRQKAKGKKEEKLEVTVAEGQPEPGTSVAITKMRRAIGKNLQMSFRDTPHFFVTMSADMSLAMSVRNELNAGRPKEKRISVNDLVVRAAALGLKQYPGVNSRMDENEIHYLPDINVGVATAVEAGLVVPVLTNADQRGWDELALETKRLALEARGGKILHAGKGTFTVSNLGMFGVEEFTAIINPPESAILAVGAVKNEVVDIGGGIGVRPMMKMTLCSDHRVVDGALAAQFLGAIKVYLEEEISLEG